MPEYVEESLREEIVKAKNHSEREFNYFTENFYVMRAALRYFSQKKGVSFTSSKIAEDFPISVPVAGSCLNVLKSLDVVEVRTRSSSPDVYMPQEVDMEKLMEIKKVLNRNYEINDFY